MPWFKRSVARTSLEPISSRIHHRPTPARHIVSREPAKGFSWSNRVFIQSCVWARAASGANSFGSTIQSAMSFGDMTSHLRSPASAVSPCPPVLAHGSITSTRNANLPRELVLRICARARQLLALNCTSCDKLLTCAPLALQTFQTLCPRSSLARPVRRRSRLRAAQSPPPRHMHAAGRFGSEYTTSTPQYALCTPPWPLAIPRYFPHSNVP